MKLKTQFNVISSDKKEVENGIYSGIMYILDVKQCQ